MHPHAALGQLMIYSMLICVYISID